MLPSSRRAQFLSFAVSAIAGAVLTNAVAQVALPEAVEVAPLAKDAFSTGTLNAANGALPPTLWDGSDPQTLEFLLTQLPSRPASASLGEALKRTLLSPGSAPVGAGPSLGGKKLLALARAGFVEEASSVASLSTAGRGDPWTGQAEAVADLLNGDIAAACRRNANLSSGRDELFWVRLRVLCYVEAGEADAADLTLGLLRDQGALDRADADLLTALVTGTSPKTPPPVGNALQYALARKLDLPVTPSLLSDANGGVLAVIALDPSVDPATRIAAAQRAVAMGVLEAVDLASVMMSVDFEIAELGAAEATARAQPGDPLSDALLYQSIVEMSAPEFLRDKARRIALALSLGDDFHRAFALSVLYADDIGALEGAILSTDEAAYFALARMAVGDSVGAGQWLSAMMGPSQNVTALPEAQAMTFIDRVNLLAVLDPQTAAIVAGKAGVSLIGGAMAPGAPNGHRDNAAIARIVEAAFDAALDGKMGQAGLAALAASVGDGPGGEIETVIVEQSLRAAGLSELQRRYAFEQAWSSKFVASSPSLSPAGGASGFAPRIKPPRAQ